MEKIKEENRFFENNHAELKDDFSRYIIDTKKNLEKIDLVEKTKISNLEEINNKLKFYQDENVRLSSELLSVQKKNENIKVNLTDIETEKEKISSKIKELSKSIEEKTNIVSTNFLNENPEPEHKTIEKLNYKEQKSLDDVINKIFSKI